MRPPINNNATPTKLKVELEIVPKTGQISGAMRDIEERARRVGNATKATQERAQRVQGGSVDNREAGSESGIVRFAAVAYVAERSLQALTTALRVFTQEGKTASQKFAEFGQNILESIPLVGGFASFGKDLAAEVKYGSRLRRLNESRERIGLESSVGEINSRRDQTLNDVGFLQTSARLRTLSNGIFNRGYDVRSPLARAGISLQRGGVADYFAGGINQIANLYGGVGGIFQTDAMKAAQRQVYGAQENLFVAQGELGEIRDLRKFQEQEVERLRARAGMNGALAPSSGEGMQVPPFMRRYMDQRPGGMQIPPFMRGFVPPSILGSGEFGEGSPNRSVDQMQKMIEQSERLKQLKEAESRLQRTINDELNKGREVEQRRVELAQRKIGANRAELDFVKSRESQIYSGRESFGMMSQLDRYNLVEGVKMLRERGWEGTPDDVKSTLLSNPATQNFARSMVPDVSKEPLFVELNKELGGALDLKPVQDRRRELEKTIENQLEESTKVFNEGIEKVTQAFGTAMERLAKQIADTETRILENQLRLQKTQSQLN